MVMGVPLSKLLYIIKDLMQIVISLKEKEKLVLVYSDVKCLLDFC